MKVLNGILAQCIDTNYLQKRVWRLELLYVTKRRIEIFLEIQVKKLKAWKSFCSPSL